ncbi:hypothetical protein [Chitinophaga polysaccharea]|uniref:hypothetical protein n=1 Tax=Chitinophaga polysaccharea TaxID=1293035 RepID=UPI0011588787|nr:hypothetical protein [Chitinophaga polysaccharea]
MKKHLSPALGAMPLACSLFISSCLNPPVILPDKQYFEITGIKGETFAGEKDSVKIETVNKLCQRLKIQDL